MRVCLILHLYRGILLDAILILQFSELVMLEQLQMLVCELHVVLRFRSGQRLL